MTRNVLQLSEPSGVVSEWNFLTKHGRVLLCVAQDPQIRLRDVAVAVELTERRVHAILGELIDSGYVIRNKDGRRNRYEINENLPLPDFTSRVYPISEVVRLLTPREVLVKHDRDAGPGDQG